MRSAEYVLHGTSSGEGAERIENEGFITKEGFPNVSQNLIYAFKWATDKERVKERHRVGSVQDSDKEGRILLLKVPDGVVVKYGDITKINVDVDTSEVTGYVKNYASGRNQLAMYHEEESDRMPRKRFETGANVEISIHATPALGQLLSNLRNDIKQMGEIDTEKYSMDITEVCLKDDAINYSYEELLPIFRTLVKTTIESEFVNTMRLLEINVLRAKGFKTINKHTPVDDWQFMEKDVLLERLHEIEQKSASLNVGEGTEVLQRYMKSGASYLLNELEI